MSESAIQSLQRQRLLLQLEYQTEKEAFRKQTEAVGIGRKVKRGDAWYPVLVGQSHYNSLNQMTVEILRTQDQDVEHNFEYGKPVMFFSVTKAVVKDREMSLIHYFPFTGTVSYAEGDRMVVVVPEGHALDLQGVDRPLGVQLSFDETSYRTMFDALDRVIHAKSGRLAYLRELFYTKIVAGRFTFAPMSFPWLNETQERAVNEVLRAKDVVVRFSARSAPHECRHHAGPHEAHHPWRRADAGPSSVLQEAMGICQGTE